MKGGIAMLIKAGVWKRLTFLEKQDLLIHYKHHNELTHIKKEQKNKPQRRQA